VIFILSRGGDRAVVDVQRAPVDPGLAVVGAIADIDAVPAAGLAVDRQRRADPVVLRVAEPQTVDDALEETTAGYCLRLVERTMIAQRCRQRGGWAPPVPSG